MLTLAVALIGSFFAVSCETTAQSSEKEIVSDVPETSAEARSGHIDTEPISNPEATQPKSEFHDHNPADSEEIDRKIQELRTENEYLRDENDRLHLKLIKLNDDLAEANAEIYSLNRKLDAIFKHEPGGS